MTPSRIDIVMPVHNRWKLTKQSLDSLFAHTLLADFNLYVIDDGSDQENQDKLKEYWAYSPREANFHIQFNNPAISPGASRNRVCSQITFGVDQEGTPVSNRSEYLYHSDNDVYFTQGWLETLVNKFENISSRVKLIGGGCHPYLQNKTEPEYRGFGIGIKDAVSGYSQLMTWETWDKYGPFDETMRNADVKIMGSEDWAFCQKIIQDGFLVGAIEPEVVIHCGKTNTYGNPATGNETFTQHEGIIVE